MKRIWVVAAVAVATAWGQSASTGGGAGAGAGGPGTVTGDVFVSPSGNDANPCTWALPCATPQHASAVVRGEPSGKHVVTFRGGTYGLTGAWTLNEGDSGTAEQIVYQNYPGETPVISGGRQVTGTWAVDTTTPCAGGCTLYYMDLDANPANNGHWLDFESLFFNGVRRPRPQQRGTTHGYLTNACPATNNATMCVAGSTDAEAEAACGCPAGAGTCAYQSSPCGGATPWMCFNKYMYSGTDINGGWHGVGIGDVELLAIERWSMGRARLASAASGVALLTGPLALSNSDSGCLPGYWYLVENVKEELAAGEWYLDRCLGCAAGTTTVANSWRLYFAAAAGENPNLGAVMAPQAAQLLTANELQNVTFQGLTFQYDDWIPGPYGLGDSQGMPLIPAAVSFTNASNVMFTAVTVNHIQGWGMEYLGASAGNQVLNSAIDDLGAGGIRIGQQAAATDTDSSVPQNNVVQNTAIAYYGRIQPTGEGPGVWLGDTHGNTITHNDIFAGYTGCVELGYGLKRGADDGSTTTQFFTYGNTISWNHCYGQGQGGVFNGVLSDFGGIYAASSLSGNCATTGQPELTPANTYCNHIVYNRIHDLAHNYDDTSDQGAQGIYLDQGTSNMEIRFNLVYRISHTCAFNNTPQHIGPNQYLAQWNLWANNILGSCGAKESNQQRVISRGGENGNSLAWSGNIGYYNAAVGAYPQATPGLWGCFADDGVTPVECGLRFLFEGNLWWNAATGNGLSFSTCATAACTGYPTNFNLYTATPWAGEDVGSLNVNPLFTNPTYPTDDWHLPAADLGTVNLSRIGFQSWDYTQAGRTSGAAIPSAPDLFPVRGVNAGTDY